MANDGNPGPTIDEPERSVIERVAQALEDKEAGDVPTIVLDTARSSAPLPPRRGG